MIQQKEQKSDPSKQPDSASPLGETADETPIHICRRTFLWIGVIGLLLVCVSIVAAYHKLLLQNAAYFLVYESELEPCDVVIMLGGGRTERIERAIKLYKKGFAKEILLAIPDQIGPDALYHDNLVNESRMYHAILKLRNVPFDDVHWSPIPFYSTFEEIKFIKSWLKENDIPSAIIVPGYFQSRRAKWTLDHFFANTDYEILVAPAEARFVSANNWWTHEEGFITVENEYLKNIYYLVKRTIHGLEG